MRRLLTAYRNEVLRLDGTGQAGPNFTKSCGKQGEMEQQRYTILENLSKLMDEDVTIHPAGTFSAGVCSGERIVREDLANFQAKSSGSITKGKPYGLKRVETAKDKNEARRECVTKELKRSNDLKEKILEQLLSQKSKSPVSGSD